MPLRTAETCTDDYSTSFEIMIRVSGVGVRRPDHVIDRLAELLEFL